MYLSLLSPLTNFLKKDGLFLVFFLIFASFYYDSVLDNPPMNNHLWRQADCLSITREYSRGTPFLEPQMNIQTADYNTSGKTAGEFPVLYYTVGKIWSIAGESYFSYRVFYLIILFFGLFAFYKSLQILFKDRFWPIAIAALLFTSPAFVIYGVSFLTDVPAFCFILIALYFLLRYHLERTKTVFILAMVFFSLAGLVKISSMIAFVFLFFILFLETLSVRTLGTKKVFRCNLMEWIGFTSVIVAILAWYVYAAHYNEIHRLKYTFNDIYPLWDPEEGGLSLLWKKISSYTSYIFFSRYLLFLMGGLFLFHFFLWKKIPLFAYLTTIIVSCGAFAYILLWGPLLGVHDYYYAALLILFPGIVLPFVWYIKTHFPKSFGSLALRSITGLFVILNFYYCLNMVKLKTIAKEGEFPIIGNKELVQTLRWMNWDTESNWWRFERMKPYLRQVGIGKEDRIISLPDLSFNVSLFLADRKGWTNFETYTEREEIELLIRKKAKFLVVSNPDVLKEAFLQPFLTDSIGNFEGIAIYRLSPSMIRQKDTVAVR